MMAMFCTIDQSFLDFCHLTQMTYIPVHRQVHVWDLLLSISFSHLHAFMVAYQNCNHGFVHCVLIEIFKLYDIFMVMIRKTHKSDNVLFFVTLREMVEN